MLQPKKMKFTKYHKLSIKGKENKSTSSYQLTFGRLGLQCIESGLITPEQIESVRRTIVKYIRGFGKVWIRIFPQAVVTCKPKEVRMGRGKGDLKTYVFKAKAGRLLFEVSSGDISLSNKALSIAATKLPVKCQIVQKGL